MRSKQYDYLIPATWVEKSIGEWITYLAGDEHGGKAKAVRLLLEKGINAYYEELQARK